MRRRLGPETSPPRGCEANTVSFGCGVQGSRTSLYMFASDGPKSRALLEGSPRDQGASAYASMHVGEKYLCVWKEVSVSTSKKYRCVKPGTVTD